MESYPPKVKSCGMGNSPKFPIPFFHVGYIKGFVMTRGEEMNKFSSYKHGNTKIAAVILLALYALAVLV